MWRIQLIVMCVWSVFSPVTCQDCWLQFSCLFFCLKVLFIQRSCLFYGKKARDAISSFGTHATILTRVQSYLAKATEPSDLDLVQFNADSLVSFEGSWRYEWLWRFFSYVFLDAKQMIHILEFLKLPNYPLPHWFGLLCQGNCEFTMMASHVWNAKRLRKECVIRKV